MEPILSREQSRQADKIAIEQIGIPESVLMEHAALAIVSALEDRFGKLLPKTNGAIAVGPGNNGGDGLACARLLWERGCRQIRVLLILSPAKFSGSAEVQFKILQKLAIPYEVSLKGNPFFNCDWIIDGILGTGLTRPVQGEMLAAIESVNESSQNGQKWVVAIDIPSGLNADTGNPLGDAVRACETVALGFLKKGLVTGLAANFTGKLRLATIQIPRNLAENVCDTYAFGAADVELPKRPSVSHKGTFGHVYIWAGAAEKQGASALTAMAALRMGTGHATVIGDKNSLEAFRPRLPKEIMTEVFTPNFCAEKSGATGAFGPGMGDSPESWAILKAALKSDWKLVLDADALTVFSHHKDEAKALLAARDPKNTILTPHPKEAARLSGKTVEEIQSDRYSFLNFMTEQWHASLILKGKGSLIKTPGSKTLVVTEGNSGLAKGGTGDILTGIVASLLAQGLPAIAAMPTACYIEGRASEMLAQRLGSERTMVGSDIADSLPEVLAELESLSCK